MRTIIISNKRKLANLALCLASLPYCIAASANEIHRYTIHVDADLGRLSVEARFDTAQRNVRARAGDAGNFLISARQCDGGPRIRNHDRRLLLPDVGVQCIRYVVDLGKAVQSEQRNKRLAAKNVLVSPAVWLWRPRLNSSNEIHVSFQLPENTQVSVPWERMTAYENTYRLSGSPENGTAPAAFGSLEKTTLRVADTELTVTLLQAEKPIRAQEIFDWVASTANDITLAYGRFPSPGAHVFVIPAGRRWYGNDAVLFGRVMRDGGETVELLVNEHRPVDEFYGNWTATHEFSHLLLPYVRSRHRWISEGFAQYYQNLLLARAGTYTELSAWQKLYSGFERGRSSSPLLSPNAAARDSSRNSTMKIYWSGAALALMADVELRRRSNGRESLDNVLDRLQACCLPSTRSWAGPELYRKLDTLVDEPVFMPLYSRYADADGFPDVRPLLERLGLTIEDDKVGIRGNAELAEIRAAITARRRPGVKQAGNSSSEDRDVIPRAAASGH